MSGQWAAYTALVEALDGAEVIACEDAARWESWLADYHELPAGRSPG